MRRPAVLLVVLVAAFGLAACASSASPSPAPPPPLGMAPFDGDGEVLSRQDRLVGAWNSTEYGEPHVEVSIREGWQIHLRGRCTGSDILKVRVTAISMSFRDAWTCDGRWRFLMVFFPADSATVGLVDLGPFTVALDRADTITSWDVEAYATKLTPSIGPSFSPWPSPTPLRA
ncbi:hypothetical protein [Dactylosporangium darangshiense]|uniref:Lipoprotein n=1 Tax=Dactylosporangium darangshiense TaxID=579108 RepID=A0ABP8CYU9_9ACTN